MDARNARKRYEVHEDVNMWRVERNGDTETTG
jgi:hypothetical protein